MSVDIARVRELARGQAMPLDEALIQVTCDELEWARDEVARLRDALRKIAACPCRTHHACQKVGMERLRCVTCIARAELGEETDG